MFPCKGRIFFGNVWPDFPTISTSTHYAILMLGSCYPVIKAGIHDTYHNKPWHFKTFTKDKSKIPDAPGASKSKRL